MPIDHPADARTDASATSYTLADFERFGRNSDVRYRLPALTAGMARRPEAVCIAEGRVDEHTISRGATLFVSNILVRHDYEAMAQAIPHLSCILLLSGRARLQMGPHDDLMLTPGSAARTACGDSVSMGALHHAGQGLRSVNLVVHRPELLGDQELAERAERAMRGSQLLPWHVPGHLVDAAENLFATSWCGALHSLLCDGVGLQLLAHALAGAATPGPATASALSARDIRLLERVRACLQAAPGDDHRLEDLARLACMSVSTLRTKFRAHFGCSVFEWLRAHRLDVARDGLAQGWTVQQAAHYVGYRHATNFATAFRARHGMPPSHFNVSA